MSTNAAFLMARRRSLFARLSVRVLMRAQAAEQVLTVYREAKSLLHVAQFVMNTLHSVLRVLHVLHLVDAFDRACQVFSQVCENPDAWERRGSLTADDQSAVVFIVFGRRWPGCMVGIRGRCSGCGRGRRVRGPIARGLRWVGRIGRRARFRSRPWVAIARAVCGGCGRSRGLCCCRVGVRVHVCARCIGVGVGCVGIRVWSRCGCVLGPWLSGYACEEDDPADPWLEGHC